MSTPLARTPLAQIPSDLMQIAVTLRHLSLKQVVRAIDVDSLNGADGDHYGMLIDPDVLDDMKEAFSRGHGKWNGNWGHHGNRHARRLAALRYRQSPEGRQS